MRRRITLPWRGSHRRGSLSQAITYGISMHAGRRYARRAHPPGSPGHSTSRMHGFLLTAAMSRHRGFARRMQNERSLWGWSSLSWRQMCRGRITCRRKTVCSGCVCEWITLRCRHVPRQQKCQRTRHGECQGGCIRGDGGKEGTCGRKCTLH